ncbi:unnamed protein product [Ceratitis capitata]|uniref:(Mediterranean fruit fly) hypothetical protein n=1 Tax=Ceratitis capitata TaxID=7213 RepID=A0A811VIM2_CERCA|nr:unnamed protein product [Ceratitis capitata]
MVVISPKQQQQQQQHQHQHQHQQPASSKIIADLRNYFSLGCTDCGKALHVAAAAAVVALIARALLVIVTWHFNAVCGAEKCRTSFKWVRIAVNFIALPHVAL